MSLVCVLPEQNGVFTQVFEALLFCGVDTRLFFTELHELAERLAIEHALVDNTGEHCRKLKREVTELSLKGLFEFVDTAACLGLSVALVQYIPSHI